MNISRIIDALVRKWWLVLLLVIIGGGMGYLKVLYTPPSYKATSTIYMINREDVYLSQLLLEQYFDVMYSKAVVSSVLSDFSGVNLTEKKLFAMTDINSKKGSNVITINAEHKDPYFAAAVANSMAKYFAATINQISNSDNVGILDQAIPPANPEPDNKLITIILGLFIGLVIAFTVVYTIEYFNDSVRTEEDVTRGLNLRVIGIIPGK